MQPEFKVVWILAVGISCAGLLGYIANRLKMSPILGYLLAGYLIGPYSPGFVADIYIAEQLANIGVTLLMFVVGLHFNWKDLMVVKKIALPGAIVLSILSIASGFLLSIALGESPKAGLIIGAAVCVSSTVVIVKMLTDQNLLHTLQGHIAIGWTIVEDLIAIFVLILLPTLTRPIAPSENPTLGLLYSIGFILLKIIGLAIFVFFIADRLVQNLLKHVARTRSHELFTLAILSVVFLIAIGSAYFAGVSLALGAFIAGVSVGKTNVSQQAAANALPMRDTFAVIFFLSIGMLFNPAALGNNLPLFLGTLFIALVLRFGLAFTITRLFKYPVATAMVVAISVSQIGEYSFILIEEGSRLNILPDNAYDIIVACSLISIALNPLLFQFSNLFIKKKKVNANLADQVSDSSIFKIDNSGESIKPRAIVIGCGGIGQAAVDCLKRKGYHTLIIDSDVDRIEQLKKSNFDAFYGDASQFQLLEIANSENTQFVVITIPDFKITTQIIGNIHQINPYAKIIVRIRSREHLNYFENVDIPVVCDEISTSKDMVSLILKNIKSI